VRGFVLCALVAGCSFTSTDGTSGDDAPGGGNGGGVDAGHTVDAPRCADGDNDGDTVCNGVDQCPGMDDLADADGDTVPDCKDDWPCGAKPSSPGDPVILDPGRQWNANNIDIGHNKLIVVAPGAQVAYEFDYLMRMSCGQSSSCKAQLEIGLSSVGKLSCAVDRTVNDDQVTNGNATGSFTAPTTPNVYDIRLNGARLNSCSSGASWYGNSPGGNSTIARLCVH
jgi:hypothetical protein